MTGLGDTTLSVEPNTRIVFGAGMVADLPAAVAGCGGRRALVVTDAGLRSAGVVDRVRGVLAAAGVETAVWDGVIPNPSPVSLEPGVAAARLFGECVVIGLGGGSSLDAAKGIALLATNPDRTVGESGRTPPAPGLPVVAVPTTAGSGAETNGFGVLDDPHARRKIYFGDASVRPRWSVLDPELTIGLPPAATAATGMDALVHGIESLASAGSSPVSAAYATEAVRLVSANLITAVADGSDLDARAGMLMGSHLAGLALSLSGLGLVHGIAHAVTAHTGAVHGLALTAVLDEVMARSLDVASSAYARVAEVMGAPGGAPAAGPAVRMLAEQVAARLPLRELGVRQQMVDSVAAGALADAVSANHPRRFTQDEVVEVLTSHW